LVQRDGLITQVNPVSSAGVDFLDNGAAQACKPGDRLPPPPDIFPSVAGGLVPLFIEFQHRVGAASDVRIRRRFAPGP
jgi:hypothetical protein